ncbi:podocalyxin [Micropterus dolomieu]|uniref:podocalyxin n=1 Tax=Micropterus dolomieu TaxID=147949 RepID=UPI001E8D1457|nr:podocalyxin [Micropterus dolomieu]
MRATMRTMWLLLSLSFLFQSVCSDVNTTLKSGNNTTANIATINATTTAAATTAAATTGAATPATTTTGATTPATTTTAATPATTTTAAATSATTTTAAATNATSTNATSINAAATTEQKKEITPQSKISVIIEVTTATSRPTDTPAPTTTTPSTSKHSISDNTTAAAASTSTPPTSIGKTTTANNTVISPRATTTQMPESPGTNKILGTEATVGSDKGETTKITKVLTDYPTQLTTEQSSRTSTSITINPSQGDGEGVLSMTTQENSQGVSGTKNVSNTSYEQTTPTPRVTDGLTGTTSSPSAMITAGDDTAAVTSGTKDGTISQQAAATAATTTTAAAQPETFLFSLNNGHVEEERKDLVEVCRRLMVNLQDGNCSLTLRHSNGKTQIDSNINGNVKSSLATQYYEEITKKPTDNKTLIAILASCGALLIMIVILTVCASHHRKPYNENQQHLTEELHTVENGYHDNPTLEVMEVQPEMQEKKMALNGEFNDSWIVPFNNLLKEDIPDEEDTHL